MGYAKRYVIYGDPDGASGSFEPIKAHRITYKNKDAWEITCMYKKGSSIRTAKIILDNYNGNILEFELINMR